VSWVQRYFVQPEQINPPEIMITGDDAHHLHNVMRFRPGDEVICCDGQGQDYLVKIVSINAKLVAAEIVGTLTESREPFAQVWLAQALPKSDKMEWIIQKGTEIGAVRFVPFTSKRTIVQLDAKKESKRLERWQKIAKEAAEQAHRSIIPGIDSVVDWKKLLVMKEEADLALIAYEAESGQMIGDVVRPWIGQQGHSVTRSGSKRPSILIAIGPEGGFEQDEVKSALEAGWIPVGLGRRILRTETAGMVALTSIQLLFGEMGG
jgi:16S rRNA (uracil1498-N3)-methyltransferase